MIPLFKVYVSPDVLPNVNATLMSGYLGEGPRVPELERAFAELVDAEVPPLAMNSCTSALTLAYRLCGVGPFTEVITTPITCTATNIPIVLAGATPVWADVDPVTGLVDPRDVARKITPYTRAIVAVDWAGRACDYAALRGLGVPVIEDAAHAMLTTIDGVSIAQAGGDYVCWSLGPIKHLTSIEGGMLLSHRGDMERGRLLRWYGFDRTSTEDFRCAQDLKEVGGKWHMCDVNATVGLGNISHTREVVERHRENARWLYERLDEYPGVTLPPWDEGSAYWVFPMLVNDRDGFKARMAKRGVAASQVHARTDKHTALRYPNGPLPGVEAFDSRQVNIPCGWWLTENERWTVLEAVRASVYRPASMSVPG